MHNKLRIGRWGEAVVYHYLTSHPELAQGKWAVEWVNQEEESGLPYDIKLVQAASRRKLYVEVKASSMHRKDFFEMSTAELDMAQREGECYHVYRVTAAGQAVPTLAMVPDPYRQWRAGQIKVYVEV